MLETHKFHPVKRLQKKNIFSKNAKKAFDKIQHPFITFLD